MIGAMPCNVRPMRPDEVAFAIDLAAREGWNPGLHDAACFHAADPGGFLLAECDGAPVGCISAVSYGGRFGFIGLYIVVPERRGQRIGRRLWDAALARLEGQVIGLDGVPAQQPFYRRSGFALAWRNVRFAGVAAASSAPDAPAIVPLADVDFPALSADDRRAFPAPRDAFLHAWVAMPEASGLAWREPDGRLAGWGVIRRCREGHKIGPLLADDAGVARALFAGLCDRVPAGDAVFLDVPLPNADAVALARERGMREVFETARMYCGAVPDGELGHVYGITTFELG
jgi:GNAT superfamily N-acetyltransferase